VQLCMLFMCVCRVCFVVGGLSLVAGCGSVTPLPLELPPRCPLPLPLHALSKAPALCGRCVRNACRLPTHSDCALLMGLLWLEAGCVCRLGLVHVDDEVPCFIGSVGTRHVVAFFSPPPPPPRSLRQRPPSSLGLGTRTACKTWLKWRRRRLMQCVPWWRGRWGGGGGLHQISCILCVPFGVLCVFCPCPSPTVCRRSHPAVPSACQRMVTACIYGVSLLGLCVFGRGGGGGWVVVRTCTPLLFIWRFKGGTQFLHTSLALPCVCALSATDGSAAHCPRSKYQRRWHQ
jgi:hypothetical protein